MKDLDTYTPVSRPSSIWKVTLSLRGPLFLDGVVRILWFGTTINVKHPNVGRRVHFLQCGNLGYTLARCSFTDGQLRVPGEVVVTKRDGKDLNDLAKPFFRLLESKAMAA